MILLTWALCFQDCSCSQYILNSLREPGSPTFWPGTNWLWKTIFPPTRVGDDFRVIQGHFCELYFYYQVSFTSHHQALDARGCGPLCWRVLFSTQNTLLLHWKVSSDCHLTLWYESSSLMTKKAHQTMTLGLPPLLSVFPFLFSITLISRSPNRPGELLHRAVQIPSSWNIMPLDIYIYDSFTSFKFTRLCSQRFSLDFSIPYFFLFLQILSPFNM